MVPLVVQIQYAVLYKYVLLQEIIISSQNSLVSFLIYLLPFFLFVLLSLCFSRWLVRRLEVLKELN